MAIYLLMLNFTRPGNIIYYKQEDINKLLEGGLNILKGNVYRIHRFKASFFRLSGMLNRAGHREGRHNFKLWFWFIFRRRFLSVKGNIDEAQIKPVCILNHSSGNG